MIRIIFILTAFTFSMLANAQNDYDKNMQQALELFDNGKFEESSKLFEKITESENENWLPNYYVALTNSLESFSVSDKNQKEALLEKAEKFIKKASEKQKNNAEILVVQAIIDTGWILYDPMMYGQQNFNKILETYTKAKQIDPKNPRVAYQSILFDMNSAKYMGGNPNDYCEELKKAIELFATFKPETKLHPNWGLKNAQELAKSCK